MFLKTIKKELLFYIRLSLHYYEVLLFYRKYRNKMKILAMLDRDLSCMSLNCIFNHNGRCRNPKEYSLERSYREVLSCSDGIWKDGRDWSEREEEP